MQSPSSSETLWAYSHGRCGSVAMMAPCNLHHLPTPDEHILMVDGSTIPVYELPLVDITPTFINRWISTDRRSYLLRTNQSSLKYQSLFKCDRNMQQKSSLQYECIKAFYGYTSYEQLKYVNSLNSMTGARLCPKLCNEGAANSAVAIITCAKWFICTIGSSWETSLSVPWGQYLHFIYEIIVDIHTIMSFGWQYHVQSW
jgi:hypothetical protein